MNSFQLLNSQQEKNLIEMGIVNIILNLEESLKPINRLMINEFKNLSLKSKSTIIKETFGDIYMYGRDFQLILDSIDNQIMAIQNIEKQIILTNELKSCFQEDYFDYERIENLKIFYDKTLPERIYNSIKNERKELSEITQENVDEENWDESD